MVSKNEPTPDDPTPTSVRLSQTQIARLGELAARTGLSRSSLISLAVSAMLDYEARTGKLPTPRPNPKPTDLPCPSSRE